jgi:hypothetical protein
MGDLDESNFTRRKKAREGQAEARAIASGGFSHVAIKASGCNGIINHLLGFFLGVNRP